MRQEIVSCLMQQRIKDTAETAIGLSLSGDALGACGIFLAAGVRIDGLIRVPDQDMAPHESEN